MEDSFDDCFIGSLHMIICGGCCCARWERLDHHHLPRHSDRCERANEIGPWYWWQWIDTWREIIHD